MNWATLIESGFAGRERHITTQIFGLPLAIMQRKHDLSSAIGAHAIVDIIRFCVLGA